MISRGSAAFVVMALTGGMHAASAQTMFGLKAGVVTADAKWGSGAAEQTASQYTSTKSGTGFGAFLKLGGGAVSLQIEGDYTQKGLHLAYGSTASGDLILTYAEVPLLLRFSVPGKVSPYVYGGAAASYEISCKVKGTSAGTTVDDSCAGANTATDTTRQKLDFTGMAGGGIMFGVGSMSLFAEGRYSLGLRTIDKTGAYDVRNRAISILGGIAFKI